MDMRKNIITIKHSVALMLFFAIAVFMTMGLLSYGFLTAKRTLSDKQAAVDAVIACLDEHLVRSATGPDHDTRDLNAMGDELQAWLGDVRKANGRLQKQCSVAAGFESTVIWENNIEKTAVPAAWLANLERSAQALGTALEYGDKYADEGFFNEILDEALLQTARIHAHGANELVAPTMSTIASVNDMTFFIVNEDGTFVVPRTSSSAKRNEVWDRYHAQLVNEMRQQQEGWLFYPPKAAWQIDQPQYALRFMTAGETGAVLAVETYFESELAIAGKVLNKKVLAYFMVIFLAALIVSALIAYYVARRMDAFVAEFTGKSCSLPIQHKKGFAIRAAQPLEYKRHHDIQKRTADDRETLDLKEKLATLKKAVYEQAIDASRINKSVSPQIPIVTANEAAQPAAVTTTSRLARQDKAGTKTRPAGGQKMKEVFYDDITLDVQGIRSSELRKLIGEFRDAKSNDTRD